MVEKERFISFLSANIPCRTHIKQPEETLFEWQRMNQYLSVLIKKKKSHIHAELFESMCCVKGTAGN